MAESKQAAAVRENVEYIGEAECDVCGEYRADVARFKTGIFAKAKMCDTCCGLILRGYSPERGGAAE